MLMVPPTGVFVPGEILRTRYGWLLDALEQSGADFGREFMTRMGYGSQFHSEIFHLMIGPEDQLKYWNSVWSSRPGREAVGGIAAGIMPYLTPDSSKYLHEEFFKLPERYKLTDQVFASLRSAEVPEGVLAKLSALKGREFTQQDFAKEIGKALGSDDGGEMEKKQSSNMRSRM